MKVAALIVVASLASVGFTNLCLSISDTAESLAVGWLGSFLIGWFAGSWFFGKVNK